MGWGPKAPDMSGANEAARTGAAISKEEWDYYQKELAPRALQQMDDQIQIGRDTYDMAKEGQNFQMGLMRKYDDRYWNTQTPLEDSMIADAQGFDSGQWSSNQMGLARGDIAQAFAGSQATVNRDRDRMGINPSSGSSMAMRNDMAKAQALAEVQARSKINLAADQLGWSRKGEVAALGRGLPGFSTAASSSAGNWGSQGLNAGASGMQGIIGAGGLNASTGGSAASGLQSASGNLRANAVESAKNPGFDAMMGLAAGGMKLAGATYGGEGWSWG